MKIVLSSLLALSLFFGGAAFAEGKTKDKANSAGKSTGSKRHSTHTNRTGSRKHQGNVPANKS